MKFNTIAIHSHQEPEENYGAVIQPIYQTSTYAQSDAGIFKEFDYTRCGNPNIATLEGVMADLEGGKHGFNFASGMGALTTMSLALLKPGDHILVGDDVYGGTFRFYTKVFSHFNVDIEFIDMTNLDNIKNGIKENTKLVYLETPTNPLLKLVDIEAAVAIAQEKGITTCVDNTFASPYLQNPFQYGADIILHSTTKYIGGHSDVVGGSLVLRDDTFHDAIRFHLNSIGTNSDPFAAWLTLRGLKTLGVRMEAHCKNAMALATFLESHPAIESVVYPGLESHPDHELAKKQMRGFGGMISARVKGGEKEARTMIKSTKIFTLAESLGGVESLIEIPAFMTHLSIDKPVRDAIGITDNLVRFSVGIEDIDDLRADVDQALHTATGIAVKA